MESAPTILLHLLRHGARRDRVPASSPPKQLRAVESSPERHSGRKPSRVAGERPPITDPSCDYPHSGANGFTEELASVSLPEKRDVVASSIKKAPGYSLSMIATFGKTLFVS
jgi:hypothetical protein